MQGILFGLLYLFEYPNANDCINFDAAQLMRNDIDAYKEKVSRTLEGGNIDGIDYIKLI